MKKKADKQASEPRQILNRKARYDYEISESMEAGIVLQGAEVKSLFLGRANLTDAYCRVINGELWLFNLDIEPYENASTHVVVDRRRDRKLLMRRQQIDLLERKAREKGFSLLPLKIYFTDRKNRKAKVEVGLGRGRASYEKRDKISKDETRKDIERLRSGKY